MKNKLLKKGSMLFAFIMFLAMTPTMNAQYCEATSTSVEPITRVLFADIDNASSPDTSGPGYEDFTAIVAEVESGETYSFAAEGNTNGPYKSYFTVWIDWNQNDEFESDEMYEIGFIASSDGTDGQQVTNDIVVPGDAVSGETRMRVRKKWNAFPDDPCDTNIFGQTEDYTVNVGGGGTVGLDCDQGDDSSQSQSALPIGVSSGYGTADDFIVSAGNTLNIQTISVDIWVFEPIDQIEFIFYEDDNGAPGNVLPQSVINSPDAEHQVLLADLPNDMSAYQIYVDVDLNFEGGSDGASYWMQPVVTTATPSVGWEITRVGSLGAPMHTKEDGGPWIENADGYQGVFKLYCEQTDPIDPPPTPCEYDTFDVEPITHVVISDIDNTSDATIDGSPSLEDFTNIVGEIEKGIPYDIALEGNTNGDYANYFTVFIDYTEEGEDEFSNFVMFEIGSITNSDGTDGQQATGTITIDQSVPDGIYTMRIIKNYGAYAPQPCGLYGYGQAEDYTINVGGGGTAGIDCDQGDDSNGFENGLNIIAGGTFRNADDFMVSSDNTLNIKSIELNVISDAPITSLDLNFYNDDNGAPGNTVIESVSEVVPYAQVAIGAAFGYTVYAVFVEVDLDFEGGSSGETFWMQPAAQVNAGQAGFWEVSTVGTLGAPIHTSEEQGPWTPDEDGAQAVFKLHCDVATPPDPVCLFDITTTVEPITRLIMANVDNSSPANSTVALEDFTDTVINVEAGETYDVAMEGFTGGGFTNYFTIFLNTSPDNDWSAYETFEIGSINGSTGDDGQQATNTITIPADLAEGEYLLRVVKNFNSSPLNPCSTYSYGQGEDYTLLVGELEDCSGTPDAGVASVDPGQGNPNSNYTVSATGYASANGLTFQWQSNTDGAGWEDEGDLEDHYSSFEATAPAEEGIEVEWRLEVTCTFSQETAYSETATFSTVTSSMYCTPELDCADGDMITNVTFQDIDNTTTCSSAGYGDYTSMMATVQSGGTYPISVTVGDGWAYESVSVWIDFDDNGTFDEDEFFYIGTGSDEALTGDIAIPADATDGNYRMRVRVAAVGEDTATWDMACDETQGFGETEDYTVLVDGIIGVGDFATTDFSYYPNPMEEVLYISAKNDIESVSAFNVLGQQVLSNKHFADGKVDVSSLSTGTFMFRVTFESGQIENFKVVKK